jgi:hypothetical protein
VLSGTQSFSDDIITPPTPSTSTASPLRRRATSRSLNGLTADADLVLIRDFHGNAS